MKSNHLYSCKFCKIQIMFTFHSARSSKTPGESSAKFDGDAEKFRFGVFFLLWITNVKQLFLWGIFFAVSKCYVTLISCNSCPPCHKDLLFTLQGVPSAEEWEALHQKWEKPEKMEAFYVAGSIRAISQLEELYSSCLPQCGQMLKCTMEVRGKQNPSELSEFQFIDLLMQPHSWPPPASSWPALPLPAPPPALTLNVQLPV